MVFEAALLVPSPIRMGEGWGEGSAGLFLKLQHAQPGGDVWEGY